MENYSHPDINDILQVEGNSVCIDCGEQKPKWASMNNGVFLCLKCAGVHRSFGMSISLIRSLQIDSWTESQLLYLTKGGNNNFNKVLSEFNIDPSSVSLEVKYKSKAADYYRRYLKNEVSRESDSNYVPTQIVKPEIYEAQEILETKEENNKEVQSENKPEEKKTFFGFMSSVFNKVKESTANAAKSVEKGVNDLKIGEKLKVAGNAIQGAAITSGNFIADQTQKAVYSDFVQNISKKTKEGVTSLYEKTKNVMVKDNKNKEEEKKVILEEDNNSLFEDIKKKNQDISKESILSHIKVLIKSPIFILMNITLASMFIIVSAVQFWINDYLEYGLLIEDENKRLYAFAFVVITSPPAGIILGGILSGKVGGYDTEKAIYIPLITSFFVCIIANIAPLTSNIFIFLPFFWIYLFLGSVLLPVANGIILVSVDKKYAGSANSVSTLIYNILGRLPGPNLYAFFKSQINDKHSRIPFWLLLNMSIPGFIAVLICVKFQKQKYRNLKNLNLTEEEILNFDNKENENNNKKFNKKDYKEFKDIINDEN